MRQVYQNILVIVSGFCVLHLVFAERTIVFLIVATTILFISAISNRGALFIDKTWLWIGEKMGLITSPIILFLVYYLLLTPIAFLSRIGRKDPLQLRAPEKSSFIFKHHRFTAKDLKDPW
jgi:hypothetical protein